MIQGVIFDMDGLMFDTERIYQRAWIEAGRRLGAPITDEVVLRIRGRNVADSRRLFGEMFGDSVDYDAVRAIRVQLSDEAIAKEGLPPKPGLYELFDALDARGINAALATSTVREKAMQYLSLAGLTGRFAASVCGDEVTVSKPDPGIFLRAAALLGVPAEACIVLEDSPNGITAAHRANAKPVMVPDLTPPDDALRAVCAAVVPTLSDVIPLLDTL